MAQALSGGLCPDAPGGPPAIADPHRISGGFPPVCPGLFPSWSPLIRLAGKCSVSPTPPPGCGRIGPPTSGHLRLLWAGRLVLYGSGNRPKSRLVPLGAGPVRPLPPLFRLERGCRFPGWAILRLDPPPAALIRSHRPVFPAMGLRGCGPGSAPLPGPLPPAAGPAPGAFGYGRQLGIMITILIIL